MRGFWVWRANRANLYVGLMTNALADLLSINKGSVTAPAGCGKTHLIAHSLTQCSDKKPTLILTHTNAGAVALRQRLSRNNVPSKLYRVWTVDGWAMRLVSVFPKRSEIDPRLLLWPTPAPTIRTSECRHPPSSPPAPLTP